MSSRRILSRTGPDDARRRVGELGTIVARRCRDAAGEHRVKVRALSATTPPRPEANEPRLVRGGFFFGLVFL